MHTIITETQISLFLLIWVTWQAQHKLYFSAQVAGVY